MTCAVALRGVSPSEKLVLLTLANYADEHMECWPSQARLGEDCCMTERGVRKILAALEERGLLSRSERRRHDGYRAADRVRLNFSAATLADAEPISPEPCSPERGSPEPSSPERDADLTGTERPISPERGSGPTTLEPISRTTIRTTNSARETPSAIEREFEETFWPTWPEKVGKGAARKAYLKARQTIPAAAIMAGVPNVTRTNAWRGGHHVHAATWLNAERWADEPEAYARGPPITGGMLAAASDELGYRMALELARNGGPRRDDERNQSALQSLPAPSARSG